MTTLRLQQHTTKTNHILLSLFPFLSFFLFFCFFPIHFTLNSFSISLSIRMMIDLILIFFDQKHTRPPPYHQEETTIINIKKNLPNLHTIACLYVCVCVCICGRLSDYDDEKFYLFFILSFSLAT